jgi:hypothetical protein
VLAKFSMPREGFRPHEARRDAQLGEHPLEAEEIPDVFGRLDDQHQISERNEPIAGEEQRNRADRSDREVADICAVDQIEPLKRLDGYVMGENIRRADRDDAMINSSRRASCCRAGSILNSAMAVSRPASATTMAELSGWSSAGFLLALALVALGRMARRGGRSVWKQSR